MITRAAYLTARLAEDPLRGTPHLQRVGDVGYVRQGRPYVILRCHCTADGCPGWAPVHDDPGAIAYFNKLFGQKTPPLPHPPAAALAIEAAA